MTDVAFSHDGAFLAVCDASKVVTVFNVADNYSVSGSWFPHLHGVGAQGLTGHPSAQG